MTRYMLDRERQLVGVHFEKGHYIVCSPFTDTSTGYVTPAKMTALSQGYAVAVGKVVIHLERVTYTENILRSVWYRLAEESGGESEMATAEEVRPILIHREHAQNEGQYSCDCGIDLQQAHVPAGTQIWRVSA